MSRLVVAFAIAFVFALAAETRSGVAHAQDVPWTDTAVTVQAPPMARQGESVRIVARLTTTDGTPIAGEFLMVNAGTIYGGGTTDAGGTAPIDLRGDMPAGQLALTVLFQGSTAHQLSPSASDVVTMKIVPIARLALSIEPLGVVEFGGHPDVVVHAVSAAGPPQADAGVDVMLNGEKIRSAKTDETGTAHVALPRDLAAGAYTLTARFRGSVRQGIATEEAESRFSIAPGTIRIQSVPSLPGSQFVLTRYTAGTAVGSQTATADDTGLATFTVREQGGYTLEVLPVEGGEEQGMRAEFARWSDDSFTAARLLRVTSSIDLQAGYDVTALVGHSFKDLGGDTVDRSLVGTVTLSSSLGELIELKAGESAWLRASRVVRRVNGLESTQILYSVKSVVMDSSNVVNEYEQRFYAEPHKQVQITVSLFAMNITTSDAIFGFPVGKAIRLTYTDGRVEELPLGSDHAVHLYSLPRGEYKVKVVGGGMSSSPPVALSRNQDIEIRVISYLDMALVGGTLFLIVVGLLAFGRGRLGSIIRRRFFPPRVKLAQADEGPP